MTLQEFKAWFDGFTEQMDKPPTAKQWDRIKKRVKEIDGVAVTERVFVDRYWPHVRQYYPVYGVSNINAVGMSYAQNARSNSTGSSWQGAQAMSALGKADAGQCN